jgi:tetratricopeptide (TPR) repeat protein
VAQSSANPSDPPAGTAAAASAAAFLDEAREKLKQDDAPGALICLRTIAGLAGCPPDLIVEACKMLAQAGDDEGALACYVAAGTSYLHEQRDISKARQVLQAGHALDVHNLDVIFMLGQTDVADGRMQDGLAKFIDVLRKSNLKHVPALFEAGCIYQSNGQYDQAMLAFKKVLDRDKSHVQASVRIGQLYQSKEHMSDAVAYYVQAAQIARECQHWGTARQIASLVLALDPQNQKARVLLADLEEQGLGADEPPIEASPAKAASSAPAARQGTMASGTPAKPAAVPAAKAPTQQAVPARGASATPAAKPAASLPASAPVKPAPAPYSPAPKPAAPPPAAFAPKPAAATGPTSSGPAASDVGSVTAPKAGPPLVAQVAAKTSPQVADANTTTPPPPAATPSTPPQVSGAPPAATPAGAQDLDRARQMLGAIEAQRQAAQQDLQMLLTTRDELQKSLAEQRTILETATMRRKELDEQLASAQSAVDQATEARAASGADAAAGKDAIQVLTAEKTTLETTVAGLRAQIQALSEQRTGQDAAIKELGALREKLTGEVGALTGKMQDAKKLTDELEAMRAATPALDPQEVAKAQALLAEVGALETKRTDHESKVSAAQTSLAELTSRAESAQREAAEAEALRASRQDEADALAQRVAALTATLKELEQRTGSAAVLPTPAGQPNVGPQGAHARAAAHLAAGEFPEAIEAYCQALRTNPQDADAAYQAGALTAEHGDDMERADRLLTQAAELRPEHAATRFQLALVKARRGNVVEGAEMLTSLARSDANNSDFVDQFVERLEQDAQEGDLSAKYRLGVAYRELGRVEEALVTLQSLQHEPEFVAQCLIAIGLCLRRQGLDGAAAKRFAKTIETPGYPEALYLEALYNLGDLYEVKGTQESLALALSSFEELYARDCTYRDVGERVRVVRTNLGSAERQKVKRLPTRMADGQGNP